MTPILDVAQAGTTLRFGGVIAYPTEAVWGLGCDPRNPSAVNRILEIKQRELAKGLILIAADVAQLQPFIDLAALTESRRAMVLGSWPGPHTWIVPAGHQAPPWITGMHDSIAVRVSAHPEVVALCKAFGGALVSTSANPGGMDPPRNLDEFDPEVLVSVEGLIAGSVGDLVKPTTIRDARNDRLVRAG